MKLPFALCVRITTLLGTAALCHAATQVVLLGTGTPNADPERSGPATAVVVNGTSYLVDSGPGVVRPQEPRYGRGQQA